jgi:hypothetical protein
MQEQTWQGHYTAAVLELDSARREKLIDAALVAIAEHAAASASFLDPRQRETLNDARVTLEALRGHESE